MHKLKDGTYIPIPSMDTEHIARVLRNHIFWAHVGSIADGQRITGDAVHHHFRTVAYLREFVKRIEEGDTYDLRLSKIFTSPMKG